MARARNPTALGVLLVCVAWLILSNCDRQAPDPVEPARTEPPKTQPIAASSAAKPAKTALQIIIDRQGPRIGSQGVDLTKPDADRRLAAAVDRYQKQISGEALRLVVARQARWPWVSRVLSALDRAGAGSLTVRTETRGEFPGDLQLTPEAKAGNLPACTPAVAVLEDRSTAVWKLSGGTASRQRKGMAGPDLTMAQEALKRQAQSCSPSPLLVGAAPDVEWGLVYDLAAAAQRVPNVNFSATVLLGQAPVAGRPVKLSGS